MNIKKQRGVTLIMLVITIVVMLVVATILVSFTIEDKSIISNTERAKIEEEIRTIKSRVDSEVKAKQAVEGKTEGVSLTKEEQAEILGKYFYEKKLVVDKNGVLCRHYKDNWKDEVVLLNKLQIYQINEDDYVDGTREEEIN